MGAPRGRIITLQMCMDTGLWLVWKIPKERVPPELCFRGTTTRTQMPVGGEETCMLFLCQADNF